MYKRQGHVDDFNSEVEKLDVGVVVNEEGESVPMLAWVDDLQGADTEPKDLQKTLNTIYDISQRYRIEFGEVKSKVMVIGGKQDTPKPSFKLGDMNLKYTEKYKYLGEIFNSNNNLKDQIEEIRGKTEGAYQTILTVAKDRQLRNIELETIWRLFEASIQSIMLYGSETWDITKKEYEELNRIQEEYLKRILMAPITTPRENLYLETGLLDIQHLSYIRRINMYFRLKENPSTIIEKVTKNAHNSWFTRTEKLMEEMKLDVTQLMNVKNRQQIVKKRIRQIFKERMEKTRNTKSKVRYLLSLSL